jgi:ubiquinone/menaquinone biosynthesis C-methylase UbiE
MRVAKGRDSVGLNEWISAQFSSPEGLGGSVISFIMNRQNRPMYEDTIQALKPNDTDRILDIGCGNGYVTGLIARRHPCTLMGIDPSESIIKAAQRRRKPGITFQCGAADSIPVPAESFDKVYTINTVYFWPNLGDGMKEIWRVLRPGGLFVNTFYANAFLDKLSHTQVGYRRIPVAELRRAAEDAGFSMTIAPIVDGAAWLACCRKA